MSVPTSRLQGSIVLIVMAAASCVDDTTPEPTTEATTGTGAATTTPGPTGSTTVDVPTSTGADPSTDTGDPTGMTAPVDPSTSTTADTTSANTTTGDPDTTDTAGTTDTTDTIDSSSESESSTGRTSIADASSSDTGGEPPSDAFKGKWCGTTGTGPLKLDAYAVPMQFAASNGGPKAFAGWVTNTDEVRMAVYDVAAATWEAPTTLETGYKAMAYNQAPIAAVDGQGNAIVAYVRELPEWHVVIQRHDVVAAKWTASELTGDFTELRIGELSLTANGHAVLSTYDNVGPFQITAPSAWFFHPEQQAWSGPTVYPSVDALFHDDTLSWAQDPTTGDAVFALAQDSGKILLRHRVAATGVSTSTEQDVPAYPADLTAIGGGEFLMLSDASGFDTSGPLYAHHFDGVDWQEPEVIGEGISTGPVRLVGSQDGGAIAIWSDAQWGTYVRTFDHEDGWAPLLTAQASDPDAQLAWISNRIWPEGDGFWVGWSSFTQNTGISTFARKYDGSDWGPTVDLDPEPRAGVTRLWLLMSLGIDRARAVWQRDKGMGALQFAYACHTPILGWSPPTVMLELVRRLEHRPGGDLLMITTEQDLTHQAEYFTMK